MPKMPRREQFYSQKPAHRLGDHPVEAEFHDRMEAIVKTVDEFVNGGREGPEREYGFVLMMFRFGDKPGRCNYMSNGADRKDVVTLMKEMVARFEGMPEVKAPPQ